MFLSLFYISYVVVIIDVAHTPHPLTHSPTVHLFNLENYFLMRSEFVIQQHNTYHGSTLKLESRPYMH